MSAPGLRRGHARSALAVNGARGVLAGSCSLALAMAIGFRAVAWIGVAGYVAAGLLFASGTRR